MNLEQGMVKAFHEKMGLCVNSFPTLPSYEITKRRIDLILEEVSELEEAIDFKDMREIIDAIADILYVTYGAAVEIGVDIEPMFRIVHEANMTKSGAFKDKRGKILKPPNFVPPDIDGALKKQGEK